MKRSEKLMAAGVVILTVAVYLRAMGCGWIWDDDQHITANICLLTLHGLGQIWFHIGAVPQYYPITHTSFWIEHHLWGNIPLGYHLDNVLLQAANVLLIGWLLTRLKIPGAWLAAAIWAVHPMQVETVAWVSERKNLLSGFFYLLSLHAAIHVWRIDESPQVPPPPAGWGSWLICFGLFLLAILAKSVTASLPAVILLLMWLKERPITLGAVLKLVPFFAASLAMGSLTGWMERHFVGAIGHEWELTPWQRIAIADHAVWFYLGKLFWPGGLSFMYAKWELWAGQMIFAVGVVLVIVATWGLRNRIGRGPLVAILFFVGTLFPAMGFVNVYPMRYSYVADHFQYLACLGPIVLVSALLSRWRGAWLLIVPLIVLTEIRIGVFENSWNLWTDVVTKNPGADIAYGKLGDLEFNAGQKQNAEADWKREITLKPNRADGWMGLGRIYANEGRLEEAAAQQEKACQIDPTNSLPLFYLAEVKAQQGDVDGAIADYHRSAAIGLNPARAYNEAGQLETQQGDDAVAVADFGAAIDADPNLPAPHVNISGILLEESGPGLTQAAIAQCEAALDIDPNDVGANNNMGIALAREGDYARAVEYFRRALRADPNSVTAKDNLRRLGG